jgi:hypothetical protein
MKMGNLPETCRENMTLAPNIWVYIFISHRMIAVRRAETINNNKRMQRLDQESKGNWPLWRPRLRLEDTIKLSRKEIKWEGTDRIVLDEGWKQWRALVNHRLSKRRGGGGLSVASQDFGSWNVLKNFTWVGACDIGTHALCGLKFFQ